ncbi:MAG: carbohydrate porin [Deltaproteobacteria bacterium]|nr:carbohydrate porin [Deltaproteobacteria bacterium]
MRTSLYFTLLTLAVCISAGASAQALSPDYSGDLWSRTKLTGDWGGTRTAWASKGFTIDLDYTGTYQNIVNGGFDEADDFVSSADLVLNLDTGKAGLWPGGFFKTRVETRFGKSVNSQAGTLQPVNGDALFPAVPDQVDQDVGGITELTFTQFLSPKFGVILGLINGMGGDANELAGSPGSDSHFLNSAFRYSVIAATIPGGAPMVTLAAGAIFVPNDWILGSLMLMDTEESSGHNPFDTNEGTTLATEWTIKHELGGESGGQVIGLIYSFDTDFVAIGEDPRDNIPNTGVPATDDDVLAVYYNVYQYVWSEGDRKWGVFGRFGFTDGEAIFDWDMSVGVGGKGMFSSRPNDTFGLGYYYTKPSDAAPLRLLGLDDEQGMEAWYNFEITPWFHLTADLQVIDPGQEGTPLSAGADTAWVLGLRTRLNF